MGWLWGSSDSPDDKGDPLRELDPELRDFLQKESPVKYDPTPPPPPPPPPVQEPEPKPEPKVPAESLFPDGRYAHLWKNYRPQSEIEDEVKTPREKLTDIWDGYKTRKAQIARVAIENCSNEHAALHHCYHHGGFTSKMTVCRKQSKAFSRCYTVQARLLRSLGYMSTYERTPEMEEKIQMHADKLYHRMLEQEAAIEEAKAKGLPQPEFAPIVEPHETVPEFKNALEKAAAQSLEERSDDKSEDVEGISPELQVILTPESQKALLFRMRGKNAVEREIEERAALVDAEQGLDLIKRWSKVEQERRARRESGHGTIPDKIAEFLKRVHSKRND